MKIRNFSVWFIILIVVGAIIGLSTWHQWSGNQETVLERMRPIPPVATFAHGGRISYIAFDPKNPDLIACAGSNSLVKVWNRNDHDSAQLTLEVRKDSDSTTTMVGLEFSPTDDWIATKTFWTLEIWDSTSGDRINTLHTTSSEFTISPVGNAIATDNVSITLWDIDEHKNIKGKIVLPPKIGWDAVSLDGLERIHSYPKENINITRYNIPTDYGNECVGHRYSAIDFSHDGKWIAAAGETLERLDKDNSEWIQNVKIWDLQKQQLNKIIKRNELKTEEHQQNNKKDLVGKTPSSNDMRSIQFSHDGRFFGLAADNGFTVWSLPDWNIFHEVLGQRIEDIAFSPDGRMFAVAGLKGITLWSIDTLKPIALLKREAILGFVTSIAFSPDSATLAGGSIDGVLGLWDVRDYYE